MNYDCFPMSMLSQNISSYETHHTLFKTHTYIYSFIERDIANTIAVVIVVVVVVVVATNTETTSALQTQQLFNTIPKMPMNAHFLPKNRNTSNSYAIVTFG